MIIQASQKLGKATKTIRELRDLSRGDLAARLNTNEEEIEDLEESTLFFGSDYLERLAAALDIPVNVLGLIAVKDEGDLITRKLADFALKLLDEPEAAA